jgi:hypothetical protein
VRGVRIMEVKGEKNNDKHNMIKSIVGDASKLIRTAVDNAASATSDMLEKQKIKNKINEIEVKIKEHKYNIGKYIYDNEIEIDDGVIISKINTIDRLVDELAELEGKTNG